MILEHFVDVTLKIAKNIIEYVCLIDLIDIKKQYVCYCTKMDIICTKNLIFNVPRTFR